MLGLRLITIILVALCATLVRAEGLKSLEEFIKTAKTGRAQFSQTVTAPAREGAASGESPRVKNSSGSFEFSRPARFRFSYKKPFEQLIVADGQTLWLHDIDLGQVSQRKQSAALAQTPAAILATATDLSALRQDFSLADAPEQDGLQWAVATPKARDGQIASIRIGFKAGQLSALDILDNFGQRSTLRFTNVQINIPIAPEAFRLSVPAGAEVIKQ